MGSVQLRFNVTFLSLPLPTLQDVRIGCLEGPQVSLDLDESFTYASQGSADRMLSSSPPQSGRTSPPASQTPGAIAQLQQKDLQQQLQQSSSSSSSQVQESLELQVDYWPLARPNFDPKEKLLGKGQDPSGKNSIKSTFRHLQVCVTTTCMLCGFCLQFHVSYTGVATTASSKLWRVYQRLNAELCNQGEKAKK